MAAAGWTLPALLLCSAVATASAQNPNGQFIIPPPPRLRTAPNQPIHQPRLQEPGRAYDWMTSRRYSWSCDRKTWVDDKTGQEIGYDGYAGQNGEIIPPPERDAKTGVRAMQLRENPVHATDSGSGTDLTWDYKTNEWTDTKTGRKIPAQGWILSYCPERVATLDKLARGTALRDAAYDEGFEYAPLEIHLDLEYGKYINWKDVIATVPGAATTDGNDSGKGFGATAGFRFWNAPIYGTGGGYCQFGLDAMIQFSSGRSSTSDVTDCGGGFGLRFYPVNTRVQPYLEIGGLYHRNTSKYKELKSDGSFLFSETRTLSGWTGRYRGGMVIWPSEQVGIDIGAGYYGKFKSTNADENIRLSTGLVLRLGKQ